jgi:hypothetical protein
VIASCPVHRYIPVDGAIEPEIQQRAITKDGAADEQPHAILGFAEMAEEETHQQERDDCVSR